MASRTSVPEVNRLRNHLASGREGVLLLIGVFLDFVVEEFCLLCWLFNICII